MGITYQESLRMRRTQPMNQQEIINFYATEGETVPERFADCEQARRCEIVNRYRPFRAHIHDNEG